MIWFVFVSHHAFWAITWRNLFFSFSIYLYFSISDSTKEQLFSSLKFWHLALPPFSIALQDGNLKFWHLALLPFSIFYIKMLSFSPKINTLSTKINIQKPLTSVSSSFTLPSLPCFRNLNLLQLLLIFLWPHLWHTYYTVLWIATCVSLDNNIPMVIC